MVFGPQRTQRCTEELVFWGKDFFVYEALESAATLKHFSTKNVFSTKYHSVNLCVLCGE